MAPLTRTTRRLGGTIALALLLAAGCGAGGGSAAPADEQPASASPSSPAPGSDEPIRSCDLVSLGALSEALDVEVILDPSAANDTTCSYLTKGAGAVIFSIDAYPAAGSAEQIVDEVLAMDDSAESVDIGEAGYVAHEGTQVGFIQDGINYQVNLGGLTQADVRTKTIAVAQLIERSLK